LRYAAATGTVLIRWEGARRPTIWTVSPPEIAPLDARLELVRRYLRVFGPTTSASFARWSSVSARGAAAAFELLAKELTPVQTPLGGAWILAEDEPAFSATSRQPAAVRLLPSGDAYFLLHGAERELLVPDAARRALLWTTRVWPGALLVEGEIAGTWRRSHGALTVRPWGPLSRAAEEAVETEAASLPIPGLEAPATVRWDV
jgi:hypothetical protein